MFSRTDGSRTITPRVAASETEPMIATGIAINSGQGVAITSTAKNRVASPESHHANAATNTASGVYTPPSTSPRRRSRGRRCCDCSITRMIRA